MPGFAGDLCLIRQRNRLEPGNTIAGPCIIESYDTTIVVPPAARVRADAVGNLLLDLDA